MPKQASFFDSAKMASLIRVGEESENQYSSERDQHPFQLAFCDHDAPIITARPRSDKCEDQFGVRSIFIARISCASPQRS